MRRFLLGFLTGLVALPVAGFCYVRFGFVDPRADIPMNNTEQRIAMPSLDASVDRRAPEVANPLDSTESNLVAGMKIYQNNCASCHGDISHSHGMLADAFYPRAPQFVEEAPDMPEYKNFYIIKHGVRLSGMPAWNRPLNEQQMWQVTAFIAHMNKLPTAVLQQWRTESNGVAPSSQVASPR